MNNLPEDCIAKILSLTTPRDVCRSSAVSRCFRSAADTDHVWNHFLPSEFPEGFRAPEGLPTKKHLFFSLVHNPLLLHGSQLSFSLERSTGNKCYMMAARALNITWGHDQRYWQWISLPDARFKEVAALKMVWWLDITGKININLLSDDTLYAAYLVFKWNLDPYGFRQPVEASLVLAGTEHDDVQPSMVSLMQNPGSEQGQHAELRSDDWYEVELGQFFKRRGDMGEIEMSLKETKRPFEKKGLIVHGIEIRPVLP
ncbi:F-box protein PP2-B11 [Raphanus sativus]|uniref:F-box protein PP2-B11 n=1 Tax=Raphanus sativus TaxID=3726 RepID=A0A6J0LL41_RAPSA|nr:F-box protein PP2-B11 [Raphanus sativus]KAJ4874326.1 F-box protein PP2-B11 [Raphanus sativus]